MFVLAQTAERIEPHEYRGHRSQGDYVTELKRASVHPDDVFNNTAPGPIIVDETHDPVRWPAALIEHKRHHRAQGDEFAGDAVCASARTSACRRDAYLIAEEHMPGLHGQLIGKLE